MGCVLCGLLNVDTVSVWVTVCCSLSSNRLDEECCSVILAQIRAAGVLARVQAGTKKMHAVRPEMGSW